MEVLGILRYVRLSRIGEGEGRNSEVFLARDEHSKRQIVVKEVPRSHFSTPEKYFEELEAMCSANHPAVMKVLYGCKTKDKIAVAMPHYPHGSLLPQVRDGPTEQAVAIRLLQDILAGLGAIHRNNLLHLDLKPSNILLDAQDRPVIADFGVSRFIGEDGIAKAGRMYMRAIPPEVLSTGNCVVESDIWQVGLLAYRILNGESHFVANCPATPSKLQEEIISGKYPRRNLFVPHIHMRLRQVVQKALDPDPSNRFGSSREFSEALSQIPIKHRWQCEFQQNHRLWRSCRLDRADRVVEQKTIAGLSDISIFTEQNGVRRRKNLGSWTTSLSKSKADSHLKRLFREFEKE